MRRVMLRSVLVSAGMFVSAASAFAQSPFRQQALVTVPVLPRRTVENGVTVLSHDKTAFDRATQLVLTGPPVTTIDGTQGDGSFDLTQVFYAALLSDGRVATYATIGAKLMTFRPDGSADRIFARHGQGPGEFIRPLSMVAVLGDTLLLLDDANNRLNRVTPEGGVVNMRHFDPGVLRAHPALVGMLPRNRMVMLTVSEATVARGTVTRAFADVVVVSATGVSHPLAHIPSWEMVDQETNYRGHKSNEARTLQFSRHAVAIVWDSMVVTGTGDGYTFDNWSADARVLTHLRVDVARRPVVQRMRDAEIAHQVAALRGPHAEGMVDPRESERLARAAPFADSLPPYSRIFVSPSKTLWVVDGQAGSDSTWSATAFRTDGAILGRLHAKGGGTPLAFGDDRVVIRTEDADGVVSITVQRIGVRPR